MGIYTEEGYRRFNQDQDSVIIGNAKILLSDIIRAAVQTNNLVRELGQINLAGDSNLPLFETLGQTNISTLFSEVFVTLLCDYCDDIIANPFEKGRPDICIIPDESTEFLSEQGYDSEFFPTGTTSDWNPYPYLGADVKATRSSKKTTNNLIQYVLGHEGSHTVSWASHHDRHSRLFGIVWDFLPDNNGDLNPGIVSIFYNDQLSGTWSERTGGGEDSASTVTSRQSSSGIDLMLAGALICPSDEILRRDFNKLLRYTGDLSDYYPASKRGVQNASSIDSPVLGTVGELDTILQHRELFWARNYRTEAKIALLELDDLLPISITIADFINARVVDSNFVEITEINHFRNMMRLSWLNHEYCRDLLRSIHCVPSDVQMVNVALLSLVVFENISIQPEMNIEIVNFVNSAQLRDANCEESFDIGRLRMNYKYYYDKNVDRFRDGISFVEI